MKMKKNIIPLFVALLFEMSACSSGPQPIKPGVEACDYCKMTISQLNFGGEIITQKGKIYKFDDLHCMIGFLKSGFVTEKDIKQNVVINYEKQNDFINVKTAQFVVSPALQSPMRSNAAGFATKEAAEKNSTENQGQVLNWNELLNQSK
jgi:copper chaperone NosL